MRNINLFWVCEFTDKNGKEVWKMLSASTTLGAKKRAFEVGFNNNLTPKYETIRVATKKEISDFKKIIKGRIKKGNYIQLDPNKE